ncbi:hypothetical protein ACLPHM_02800 [Paenalcaligenes sp. Me131]|uniref:hypothetical protein n=1 Tax=Paenalcaligenes sp. Me131 TaxID=3392636 RepID=UPI003D27FCCA
MSNNAINPFQDFLSTAEPSASTAAKLRMLLPIIENRLLAGATYAAVVTDLNSAGLEISIGVFRSTLSRIRIKNGARHQTAAPAPASTNSTQAASHRQPAALPPPKRIETPADLRQLRDEEIDLDALRQQRRESQRSQRK